MVEIPPEKIEKILSDGFLKAYKELKKDFDSETAFAILMIAIFKTAGIFKKPKKRKKAKK